VAACAVAPAAVAQVAPLSVTGSTQVHTIGFEFTDTRSFRESDLLARIALTQQGKNVGLRNTFDFLPFVTPVGDHPFDPVELQRDVVRLRRFYQSAGFLQPAIDYAAAYDPKEDAVDITFIVTEGPPLVLRSVTIAGPDEGSGLTSVDQLLQSWVNASGSSLPREGDRLNLYELPAAVDQQRIRLMNDGYPSPSIRPSIAIDSVRRLADLTFRVEPGARATFGEITVRGAESVSDGVVTRELPFAPGDPYSLAKLGEGRREILGLGIFRNALVGAGDSLRPDGTIPVRVELTEGPLRQITGEGGYDSRGGLTIQAEWLHRNFTGDARLLSVSGLAQTGVWALDERPEILYRSAVSLTQQYVFHRRLSAIAAPFAEYRDDYRDRSVAFGFGGTLIYKVDPVRSLALLYSYSDRRIEEARFGDYTSGTIDILTLLNTLAKGDRVLRNAIGLQASYGVLDDFAVPRSGILVRPNAELTVVPALNSVEYLSLNVPAQAFVPLTDEIGLAARGSFGIVHPFGKGLPSAEEDATVKFLQLRDVIFTAGGTEDVRGWGTRLLGPKFPDLRVVSVEPDTTVDVVGYIPIGGLSRMTFTFEVRLPIPWLGPSAGIAAYIDGGKVWNSEPVYQLDLGFPDEEQFFFGTGLGFLYRLPIGTFRMDLGYKLNPSYQDLREAKDVYRAIEDGTPLEEVPADGWRRLQFHLSIAVSF
jgi:outer membrane protein insertion porin family